MNEEVFIQEYKKKELLWNRDHEDYRKNSKRKDALEEVARYTRLNSG